jgi:hypothetical protein
MPVLQRKKKNEPGVVAHSFNPSTGEAEAGGFLSSRSAWSTKWGEFQDSQSYTEKPCLEKKKKKRLGKQSKASVRGELGKEPKFNNLSEGILIKSDRKIYQGCCKMI